MHARLALASLILGISGCSCDEDPAAGDAGDTDSGPTLPPGTVALSIDPATVTLRTDGLTPARQTFAVRAEKADGTQEDVSDRAAYGLSVAYLGTMGGSTFTTSGVGGTVELTATLGALSAKATITVELRRVVIDPMVNLPDPPSLFGGPEEQDRAPELVYPNDGVLLPSNLGAIEIHYRRGSQTNTLFEISFSGPGSTLVTYVRCTPLGNGCLYTPGDALWAVVADSNRGGGPVTVQVRGTDDQGRAFGRSAELRVHISAAPVKGGLYYWTTSNGTGIMRTEFGQVAPPERFYPFQGGGCHGCHSLSRNGKHMTLSINGQRDGRISLIDVAARQVLVSGQDDRREQFQTWNPSGDRFAGVWADGNPVDTNIRIRDGRTTDVVETIPIGFEPDHPDWSPRGDRIIFTRVTIHETTQRPGRGGISYVEALSAGGWSEPRELIAPADGLNHYYPAYAPDGQFFVYNRSTCNNGRNYGGECDADADDSAQLWAMRSEGGPAVELAKASGPGITDQGRTELCNSYPKWAPFVDPRFREAPGRVMWVTFSSRRNYGLREPNGSDMWLWMAAIDPDEVLAGRDGSFPAFALPFQDLETSNHIAQWTTQIVPDQSDGGPGDGNLDPGGDGGACLSLGDLCDPSNDRCCSGAACSENGPGIYLCRPNI